MLFIFIFLATSASAAIIPNEIQPYQDMVTWTVRNDNLWPLLFYYYNPCLMEHGICVRHNDGPCLEYRGIQVYAEEGWNYELLWPFQSKSCSFSVTETFDMTKAGIYSIQFFDYKESSETETQLTTTLSFGDVWTPRSDFRSVEQYFSPAPSAPSNIIYMRKEKDGETVISCEEDDDNVFFSDDDENNNAI